MQMQLDMLNTALQRLARAVEGEPDNPDVPGMRLRVRHIEETVSVMKMQLEVAERKLAQELKDYKQQQKAQYDVLKARFTGLAVGLGLTGVGVGGGLISILRLLGGGP